MEDLLWYAAKVEFADAAANKYVVLFTEYGNKQECTLSQIRPPTEVDVVEAEGYSVGESVWAMWDEDHKWYLAQVRKIAEKEVGKCQKLIFSLFFRFPKRWQMAVTVSRSQSMETSKFAQQT